MTFTLRLYQRDAVDRVFVEWLMPAFMGRRDTRSQVLFASIQSVFRKARAIGHIDCLVVDECHLISRKANSMYGTLISTLREINPQMRVVGMSGTPYRLDSGLLIDGQDALFETTAFDIPNPTNIKGYRHRF